MLRPAGIEGDAGWESKVTGARDDLLNADLELEYSLGYLDANVAPGSVPTRSAISRRISISTTRSI